MSDVGKEGAMGMDPEKEHKDPSTVSAGDKTSATGRDRGQPPVTPDAGSVEAQTDARRAAVEQEIEKMDTDDHLFGRFKNTESASRVFELEKYRREGLSAEDIVARDAIAEQLYADAQANPEYGDVIKAHLEDTMGKEWVDQKFPPSPEGDADAPEELTPEEADALLAKADEVKKDILGMSNSPDQSKWDQIQRKIGEMGDEHTREKLKKAKGKVTTTVYYAIMSAMVLFWLYLGATSVVARAAGGGGGRH